MINRELSIFLVVGSLTVLLDYLSYRSLVWSGLLGVDIAKAIGFLIGTVFAYFANRIWTFGHKSAVSGSAWHFTVLYSANLGANVFVNALALAVLADVTAAIQISFLLATGVSASLNFLGMKLFFFKAQPSAVII